MLLSLQRQILLVGVLADGAVVAVAATHASSSVIVVIIESGVDGFLGGVHVGVLNRGADVILSRK